MITRHYAVHSGLLDVHRHNFEMCLGDIMTMSDDLFPYIVELLVVTCQSYNEGDWYLQYDHFDIFVDELTNKCICIDEALGMCLIDSRSDMLEKAIVTGTLWRAYEALARYIYTVLRESIPRSYKSLELPCLEPSGYRDRIVIQAYFHSQENTDAPTPTPSRSYPGLQPW